MELRTPRKDALGNLVFGFAVKNDAPDLKSFITDVKVRWLVRVVEDGSQNQRRTICLVGPSLIAV